MHFTKKAEHKGARVILSPAQAKTGSVGRAKIDTTKPVKYFLNDSSTPSLVKEMQAPSVSNVPSYHVEGYEGGGFEPTTTQGHAAGIAVTISETLKHVNAHSEKSIGRWCAAQRLHVIPRAGKMMNAYYNRKQLAFFFEVDPVSKKEIYLCESPDIVAHELGHAILDCYRPDLWNVASLEVWAFHEAFGDMIAFLYTLTHEEIIDHVLKETGGDLTKSNVASRISDEFGSMVYNVEGPESGRYTNCLRDVNNPFKYADPATLPKDAKEDTVYAESHNFSRILSGTLYDVFVMVYNENLAKTNDAKQSIREARAVLTSYIIKAIQHTPVTPTFFESFAKTFLWVDWSLPNRPYHDKIWAIFVQRGIIGAVTALWHKPYEPDRGETKVIKIADHVEVMALDDNPLYYVEVEAPGDSQEAIDAAHDAINFLHQTGEVSDDHDTPFEISDGKLVRSHFACGCAGELGRPTKYQPEFFKPYKPQNNAGCGCGSKKKDPEVVARKTIKKGCFVRYKVQK